MVLPKYFATRVHKFVRFNRNIKRMTVGVGRVKTKFVILSDFFNFHTYLFTVKLLTFLSYQQFVFLPKIIQKNLRINLLRNQFTRFIKMILIILKYLPKNIIRFVLFLNPMLYKKQIFLISQWIYWISCTNVDPDGILAMIFLCE
jgi:hypothetical protein